MSKVDVAQWLAWAREIEAISQIGRSHTEGYYDKLNYGRLMEIAAEITARCGDLDPDAVLERFRLEPGYATAKVDVRGAVVKDGRILLVQERQDQRWCMPGGWADVGEKPSDMVVREVVEESGLTVEPYRLVGVYDANRGGRPLEFFHAYKLIFLCRLVEGELRSSHETMDARFFDFTDLPPLSAHRTSRDHLRDVLEHCNDPCRQPVFD